MPHDYHCSPEQEEVCEFCGRNKTTGRFPKGRPLLDFCEACRFIFRRPSEYLKGQLL